MAARDRWTLDYQCPQCGKRGAIDWSEEDHRRVKGDLGRTADTVRGNLKVIYPPGKPTLDVEVWCAACDTRIDPKP